jgi:hypothetical protein
VYVRRHGADGAQVIKEIAGKHPSASIHRHLEADSEPLRIAEQIQAYFAEAEIFEQAKAGLYVRQEFPAAANQLIAVNKTALGLEGVAQIIKEVLKESPVTALHKAAEAAGRGQQDPGQWNAVEELEELEDLEYQGEPVSPAMAVAHLFLAALKALYGVASDTEKLVEFPWLAMQGSHGERSIAQFAQHCTSKWAAVKVWSRFNIGGRL